MLSTAHGIIIDVRSGWRLMVATANSEFVRHRCAVECDLALLRAATVLKS